MPRLRFLLILSLPLLLHAACSDDENPSQPIADFDRSTRFVEDSAAFPIILDAAASNPAGLFVESNPAIEQVMDEISNIPYFAKPTEADSDALLRRTKERVDRSGRKVSLDPAVAFGTYVLESGVWVLLDPSSPTDSAIFYFDVDDDIAYHDRQGLVLVWGEIEYTFDPLVESETELRIEETVEVRIAQAGETQRSSLKTIIHFFDLSIARQSAEETVVSFERGDRGAASRTATPRASWVDHSMVHTKIQQREFVDGADEVGEIFLAFQAYVMPIDGIYHFSTGTRRRTPTLGGTPTESHLAGIGFGTTSNPSVIPWLLELESTPGVEFDRHTGEVRYQGHRVGDIEGTDTMVPCEPCSPPQECEDIWITWTNDVENPVLMCEIDGELRF